MSERKYLVVYSGHGLSYRFDKEVKTLAEVLELPRLTSEEAEKAVHDWEVYSDTIGGKAVILNAEIWICKDPDYLPFVRGAHYE